MLESGTDVSRDDGSIIQEIENSSTMSGEDDLLLCTFDSGRELNVIGLFELLTCLICR